MKARHALALGVVVSVGACAGLVLTSIAPRPVFTADPKYPYASPEDLRKEGPFLAARNLLADPLWDDGKAEFSVFNGTIRRYGQPRTVVAKLIVVKEDMDTKQRVKSEAGPVAGRTRTVIKQNYLHDFTTGTYDYHQMCSTFLDRQSGDLEKLAMSSTEGCGITFVEVLPEDGRWLHVSHSYWDGQADREVPIAITEKAVPVAADALPLWLRRFDLTRRQRFAVSLLPSQLAGQVHSTMLVPGMIEIAGTPDRYGLPAIASYRAGDRLRADRYWFDPAWPHVLVRFEGGNDPTVLERVKTMRIAYWKEHDPGDEKLLVP